MLLILDNGRRGCYLALLISHSMLRQFAAMKLKQV